MPWLLSKAPVPAAEVVVPIEDVPVGVKINGRFRSGEGPGMGRERFRQPFRNRRGGAGPVAGEGECTGERDCQLARSRDKGFHGEYLEGMDGIGRRRPEGLAVRPAMLVSARYQS